MNLNITMSMVCQQNNAAITLYPRSRVTQILSMFP
jgi:hypothetical protein